jgi:phage terminase small subunit
MLTPKQARFVEEYIVDLNGRQAAIRAAYSPKTAEVQASRLLRNAKVQQALKTAMRAQSRRTEITADSVVAEYAKVAFANVRDFLPKEGETIDLSRLDQDRTAAVEELSIDEVVDSAGVLHRRTRLKLHDKQAALTNLARHLGMFTDRHVAKGQHRAQGHDDDAGGARRARAAADRGGRQRSRLLEATKPQAKPGRPRPPS